MGCSVIIYKKLGTDEVIFCERKAIGRMSTGRGRSMLLCTRHKKRLEGGHTLLGVDNKGQMWLVGLPAKNSPKQK